ncbi:hypothetical protein ABNX05_17110, partial [Lysinibacillus sp. M3]
MTIDHNIIKYLIHTISSFFLTILLRIAGSPSYRRVDFGWAHCCCRFAFAQLKHLLLPLRFRTVKTF